MESSKTQERIMLSQPEVETLHRQLDGSAVTIEEIEDTSVEPPVKVTLLPHQMFITHRNRIAREREKARIEAQRQKKKQARQQADKSRRRNRA